MFKIGTKVLHKSSKQVGIIADIWNPHLLHPQFLIKPDTKTRYSIITNGGVGHVCTEDDFEVISQ